MSVADGEPMDPLARSGAIAIAIARIGIGVATFGFTRKALAGLGFEDAAAPTVALARLAGGRDIALGLHALSVAGDRERLREATTLAAAVDAGDAIAFAALSADPEQRGTALKNAPLAAAAVVAGAWIRTRL